MPYILKLKEIRQSRGINQEDMAPKLNVSLSTYRTWEQGVARLSLENAVRISEILGCTPNDLCGWYDSHPREGGPDAQTPEGELLACYRASTPDRRERILGTARDSALLSGEDAERRVAEEVPA